MRRVLLNVVRALALFIVGFAIFRFAVLRPNAVTATDSGSYEVHTITRGNINVHLVSDGSNHFLVESGEAVQFDAIVEEIRAAGVEPEDLRAVIVSHGHADHGGGARYFQERFGVTVVGGKGDLDLFAAGRSGKLCPTGFLAENMLLPASKTRSAPSFVPDVAVDRAIDTSELLGVPGRIVPLPGHTPGSLIVALEGLAFVGDLFRGGIVAQRSATTHFFMCDLEDNRRDVVELLDEVSPDAELFFTGHFGPVDRASVDAHFR